MNAMEKKRLSKEVEMQVSALKKINQWKIMFLALSAIGVAIAYAGFAGTKQYTFLGILGIAIIIISTICGIILNLGLKNGRKNVEKIILHISDKR